MGKRFAVLVISLLLVGPISACGGGGGNPSNAPDLEGTWGGPGWADTAALPLGRFARDSVAAPLEESDCPTAEGYVQLQLNIDSDAAFDDLLVCGESFMSALDTVVSAEAASWEYDGNLMYFSYTGADGNSLFSGITVFDDSHSYAYLALSYPTKVSIRGVLQRPSASLPAYSREGLQGAWSGFRVRYQREWDLFDEFRYPVAAVLFPDNPSYSIMGTEIYGFDQRPFWGNVHLDSTDYGAVFGLVEGLYSADYSVYGFQSPDEQFFGAYLNEEGGPEPHLNEWSIMVLTKKP